VSGEAVSPIPQATPTSFEFLWKAILYVSFNLAMAQSVLIPIGSVIHDVRILKRAAVLGGLGLGSMLLVAHSSMLANWNDVRMMEIPMVYITEQW
ncbi:hypothetical protein MXD81_19680, partial [Microbacteriaceae bacterium K1510]|nr:hypothetical protein [Microbacteriaceae bacterium K1510]